MQETFSFEPFPRAPGEPGTLSGILTVLVDLPDQQVVSCVQGVVEQILGAPGVLEVTYRPEDPSLGVHIYAVKRGDTWRLYADTAPVGNLPGYPLVLEKKPGVFERFENPYWAEDLWENEDAAQGFAGELERFYAELIGFLKVVRQLVDSPRSQASASTAGLSALEPGTVYPTDNLHFLREAVALESSQDREVLLPTRPLRRWDYLTETGRFLTLIDPELEVGYGQNTVEISGFSARLEDSATGQWVLTSGSDGSHTVRKPHHLGGSLPPAQEEHMAERAELLALAAPLLEAVREALAQRAASRPYS